MYIGIDLGTSGVKVILLGEQGQLLASQSEPLPISRPHPLWSEQDPQDWWQATDRAMLSLAKQHSLQQVKAIGLTGQMHGATLLDKQQRVLRPAILWNDGRSFAQCQALEQTVPNSREITGNLMMPGFTAPKLLWVKEHEPQIFQQIDKVLLPKDYLRWCITGEFASDMSDAAGTMWLNVAKRDWSDAMLDACELTREQMPALFEGNQITGKCIANWPNVGGWHRCRWWPVGVTMPPGRSASGCIRPGRRCCHWVPLASTSPSATVSSVTRPARCTASAMRCRRPGT
ncbi:Xylulose kinase [Serratia fonticola]|uniref:Xylulose kinase n=1 Tax=Serratia fonticola TaxID=47917 RepID=A0A4U9VQ48_SERFO|nr:Xylulose kinase [Serratia fonticola]